MSRFKGCPKLMFEKCQWYEDSQCDGCPIYTAYHIGRADALKEALALQRKLDGQQDNISRPDDDTWKEDMERDAQQYEADRASEEDK